jgi:superfamily II DNA or RNA helicase
MPPVPHQVQTDALARLREVRAQGHRRALVVLATGLGKTWLAVFDYAQLRDELGRRRSLPIGASFCVRQRTHIAVGFVRHARQLE